MFLAGTSAGVMLNWLCIQLNKCQRHQIMRAGWKQLLQNLKKKKPVVLTKWSPVKWKLYFCLLFIKFVHSPSQEKQEPRPPLECQPILLSPHQIHYCFHSSSSWLIPDPIAPTHSCLFIPSKNYIKLGHSRSACVMLVTCLCPLWLLPRLMWCAEDQTEKQDVQI